MMLPWSKCKTKHFFSSFFGLLLLWLLLYYLWYCIGIALRQRKHSKISEENSWFLEKIVQTNTWDWQSSSDWFMLTCVMDTWKPRIESNRFELNWITLHIEIPCGPCGSSVMDSANDDLNLSRSRTK